MDQMFDKPIQHQISLIFNTITEDIDYIEEHGEEIAMFTQNLDFQSLIRDIVVACTDSSDVADDISLIEEIETGLLEAIDQYNEYSCNDYLEQYYLWLQRTVSIRIGYTEPDKEYDVGHRNPVIGQMVNAIVQNQPAGIPLVIIIFQVAVTIKDRPMCTIRLPNPFRGK